MDNERRFIMKFLEKVWKTKSVKIGVVALCIILILTAVFFSQSGPKNTPVNNTPILLATENHSPNVGSTAGTVTETPELPESSDPEVTPTEDPVETPLFLNSKTPNLQTPNSQTPTESSTPGKDKYDTDPVPSGKPLPQEPQDITVDKSKLFSCTISIRCDTILNNMDIFNKDKLSVLPGDGIILSTISVPFNEGESVFDVLKRITREKRIQMEFVFTPMYNSAYIEGIHNIYEFDCGNLSGWMYKVNSWFPNYGCSRYVLKDGDKIEWVYTCDLGKDVGGGYVVGQDGT
jgi:hypothetical protein